MKAARKISTLVLVLFVLGINVSAQDNEGNLAERQKAPTVLGGTGLFNTFSTRTLCKGEFNFALFWNNFDRDPGDIDINQVPFNFTVGLTNRWELWVNWVTWQNTTSRQPFLLSGYQLSAVRFFGDPFQILGPPIGGDDQAAAFFPGTGALFGGILPALGRFGTPIDFPSSVFSPGGAGATQAVGLGPLFSTTQSSFYEDLPFFGEVDFVGFDALGRPVFGPRQSSNGSGDFYVGTKVNLIDPNDNWFSMALGGYWKIPISRSDHARARGRTSGETELGPILMFGQESGGKRVRVYENIGYIFSGDPEEAGVKVLDLRNKLLLNIGLSAAFNEHVEFVGELAHTHYVGGGTPSLIRNNPWDLNLGLRFFFKNGAISFGGAYRRFLNNEDEITLPVFQSRTIFVPPFFIIEPLFTTQNRTFESDGENGFVGYFSIGSRRSCPPPPAPTCVLEVAPTTVNRGERLTLTARPTTPGYSDDKVTYEFRWEVRDPQGRPVTVSGSGGTVDVPTTGIPCGNYTITTTVTATVPDVDCPSDCITTGQTTCTATFEVTEPPCPSVTCEITASPTSVDAGGRITLRATSTGADSPSFTWSTTGGQLSSTSGAEVTLDTTGMSAGSVTITVNVGTSRTRCDQPCPGGSCSTTVNVTVPVIPEVRQPLRVCELLFPFNAARINNELAPCLVDNVPANLQSLGATNATIVIDGHRDASERVGISLTRANNTRDYLVQRVGIDPNRIIVRNFGDTCPHESGNEAANRRVEVWIVPPDSSVDAIASQKRCGGGATPQVVEGETPAAAADERRPRRRTTRRRGRRPEPVIMMAQPSVAFTQTTTGK